MNYIQRKECTVEPFPVIAITPDDRAQLHAVISIDEEGYLINAIEEGVDYMKALHGKVFDFQTPATSAATLKEAKKNLDGHHYFVYNANTQRFTPIKKDTYKDVKEL